MKETLCSALAETFVISELTIVYGIAVGPSSLTFTTSTTCKYTKDKNFVSK